MEVDSPLILRRESIISLAIIIVMSSMTDTGVKINERSFIVTFS